MARGCVREGFSPAEWTSSLRYDGESLATLPAKPLSSEQQMLRAHNRPLPRSGDGSASHRFACGGTPPPNQPHYPAAAPGYLNPDRQSAERGEPTAAKKRGNFSDLKLSVSMKGERGYD